MKTDKRAWQIQESVNNLVTVTQNGLSSSVTELWYEEIPLEKQLTDEYPLDMDPFLQSPPSSPDILNNRISPLPDKNSCTTETSYDDIPHQSQYSALSCEIEASPLSISPIMDSPYESPEQYDPLFNQNDTYQNLDTLSLTGPLEKKINGNSAQLQNQAISTKQVRDLSSLLVQVEEQEIYDDNIKTPFQQTFQVLSESPALNIVALKSEGFLGPYYEDVNVFESEEFEKHSEPTMMNKDFRWLDPQFQQTATGIVTGTRQDIYWSSGLDKTQNGEVNQDNASVGSRVVECLMYTQNSNPSGVMNHSSSISLEAGSVIDSTPVDWCVPLEASETPGTVKKKRKRCAQYNLSPTHLEPFPENKKRLLSISGRHEDGSKTKKQADNRRTKHHSSSECQTNEQSVVSPPSSPNENNRLKKCRTSQIDKQVEKQDVSDDVQPGPSCSPSRFCHICTRTTNPAEVFVCGNVKNGTCRKVICHRCLGEFHFVTNLSQGCAADWECTHCRKVRKYSPFQKCALLSVCFISCILCTF